MLCAAAFFYIIRPADLIALFRRDHGRDGAVPARLCGHRQRTVVKGACRQIIIDFPELRCRVGARIHGNRLLGRLSRIGICQTAGGFPLGKLIIRVCGRTGINRAVRDQTRYGGG